MIRNRAANRYDAALSVPCGRMSPGGDDAPVGRGEGNGGTRVDEVDDGRFPDGSAELPAYAERVLEVAEAIPPGKVMSYGDVAEWLEEGGPRQVGRVMALYGGGVPWWRVVRSDGVLLAGHEPRALGHYREEGTPLRAAGRSAGDRIPRLDMARARWDGTGG
jgi:alkylated DNA nucleotide flippase Atl1